jgi:chaperonin cofactor prefoldin
MSVFQDVDDRTRALEKRVKALEKWRASVEAKPSEAPEDCPQCKTLRKDLRAANQEITRLQQEVRR